MARVSRTFKLLKTLGEGAFGAVHLAELREADDFVQTLAVKWLHPQWSGDTELVGRLRDEARLLALLSHDHIVRVHGLTRLEGRLAILMEPVEGVDLSRASGERLPPRAALEVTARVADALDAAWRTVPAGHDEPLRVVHRDIKPSNVMVTARGAVKVMDFGVARATFDAREAQTRSQQYGTARYMAPERWLDGVSEAPSDVFSLGVTLVELAGGRDLPRVRLSRAAFEADIDEALSSLSDTPAVAELAREMLAFDAEARPTAAQVEERCRALAALAEGDDLTRWSRAWVPANMRESPTHPTDGTELAEEQSAETFAVTTAPVIRTAETTTARLTLDPQTRGGIFGALAVIAALAIFFTVRAGPSELSTAVAPVPVTPVADAPVQAAVPEAPPEIAAPEVEPTAAPEVVLVPAAPPPRRAAPRRPAPAEPAPAVELVAAPTTFLTLFPDPAVTSLEVVGTGKAAPRRALAVPQGLQRLSVFGASGAWACTIHLGASPARYSVDDAAHTCTPVN